MRVRELAERSGTPIPTIKLYIRDGLLPRGDKSAKNAAVYGPTHVERLRLIATLKDPGGLALPAIRRLVEALGELGAWPRERARAAVLALMERFATVTEGALLADGTAAAAGGAAEAASTGEPAPRRAPLGLPDRAWLMARGLEEPGDPQDRLHDAFAALRDTRMARLLQLDLEDSEPLVKLASEQARFEVGLLERAARLDAPLPERLTAVLEALVVWPAIARGLAARWRLGAARRLLGEA